MVFILGFTAGMAVMGMLVMWRTGALDGPHLRQPTNPREARRVVEQSVGELGACGFALAVAVELLCDEAMEMGLEASPSLRQLHQEGDAKVRRLRP